MTGRLFAALTWVVVLLTPPLRRTLWLLAAFLWPSRLFGEYLAGISALAVVLAILGFFATVRLADRVILFLRRQTDPEDPLVRPHGGDGIAPLGIVVTLVWVVIAVFLGKLDLSLAGVAVLVGVGLVGGREGVVLPAPRPAPVPEPLPPPPPAEDGERIECAFTWLFNEEPYLKSGREHVFSASISVPKALYEHFKGQSHAVENDASFVEFVNAELGDEVVLTLASRLRQLVIEHGFDPLAEIHLAMAFTLSIVYASDAEEYGREYPKYPVETVVEKRGDCEDHAILCGALLHTLGHRCGLVLMSIEEDIGHAALVVEAPEPVEGVSFYVREMGAHMFYCEVTPGRHTTQTTTAVQWWLGMEPPEQAHDFRIFPIGAAGASPSAREGGLPT